MLVDSLGSVAVGSAPAFTAGAPREKFLVDAGTSANPTTSYNVISGKGYIDNYLQLNIQNRAATGSASSDVVASNDAATELVNYIDMGINSSGYTGTGVIGGASNGYLYSTGNDFAIGNGTAGKKLIFFTGGVGTNQRMLIDGSGNVGVGAAPTFTAGAAVEKFLVDAGSSSNPSTSYNVICGKGYIDNYLQLNIQNKAGTGSASSDLVASNNAATETVNFVDLGINSSGYTGTGVIGGASNAYLYSTGNDFAIGNGTAGKNLIFFTGGVGANERMRINSSGNVGIATTTPAAKLDIAGTYKLGSAGTVLNNMIKTSFNINDNSTFDYSSPTQVETVTVTGATIGANLIINPRTALPQAISISWSRVTGTNSVDIGFVNADSTPRAIGNITFDITVIQ